MRIEIDGNDGTGKSSLVEALRKLGIEAQDRGLLSQLTLDDATPEDVANMWDFAHAASIRQLRDDVLYVLLDAPVEVSRQRLAAAGKDLEETYHTEASLSYFRGKYSLVAAANARPNLITLDALQAPTQLLADVLGACFRLLPTWLEGESKVIKEVNQHRLLVQYKPTLFSFTHNRSGTIEGTEDARRTFNDAVSGYFRAVGLNVTHIGTFGDLALHRAVIPCPIETIVKNYHVGTPKHIYAGMETFHTRDGGHVRPGEPYPAPMVRFDWRNPLPARDECLPLALADRFIDTAVATKTALQGFSVLSGLMARIGCTLQDVCFMLTSDGQSFYGELSPDCMRVKDDTRDLDKDLFRKAYPNDQLLATYWELTRRVEDVIQLTSHYEG